MFYQRSASLILSFALDNLDCNTCAWPVSCKTRLLLQAGYNFAIPIAANHTANCQICGLSEN